MIRRYSAARAVGARRPRPPRQRRRRSRSSLPSNALMQKLHGAGSVVREIRVFPGAAGLTVAAVGEKIEIVLVATGLRIRRTGDPSGSSGTSFLRYGPPSWSRRLAGRPAALQVPLRCWAERPTSSRYCSSGLVERIDLRPGRLDATRLYPLGRSSAAPRITGQQADDDHHDQQPQQRESRGREFSDNRAGSYILYIVGATVRAGRAL